jgi:hypothetical protein
VNRNKLNIIEMKKIVLLLLVVFCTLSISMAQDYNTGIGLRGGFYNGLTIKHFISTKSAVEGIIAGSMEGI